MPITKVSLIIRFCLKTKFAGEKCEIQSLKILMDNFLSLEHQKIDKNSRIITLASYDLCVRVKQL
jgi:hypothetical protein